LSEFNILYWKGDIYIIDFPQAVDIRNNPNTMELLKRDRENIRRWYTRVIKN
jgi:serine/threonine-protein kinase RIO1